MTFRASVQSSLVGLCSCIDALSQPHDDDNETAEGVVNEVNDSSGFGFKKNFKTNEKLVGFGRCFAPSCFAWFQ